MKGKFIIIFLLGALCAVIPSILIMKLQQNCINRWKEQAGKNRGLFLLMDQWIRIKQDSKNLEIFFLKNKYRRVAIYGMSYVGLRLVKELRHSEVEIAYGIDRNASNIYSDIKLLTMDNNLPNVDAIIVTAISGYDDIRDALSKRVDCPIISIEDIFNAM